MERAGRSGSCRGLGAIAFAAPRHGPGPAHKGAPAAAQKKDAPKKDEPNIGAPHAILIDAENGGVLFERDADKLIFPASLAKLMTAEYVFNELKEGRIKLTDEYIVSENAWRKGGAPSHGSTMFAAIHSKVPVDDLLHGMIIQSANDACIVLAEGIAGNEAEFAAKLTPRAREIGLDQIGVHQFQRTARSGRAGHHARAGECSRATSSATIRNFISSSAQPDFTWNKIRQQNRNPLLGIDDGADGLKTGFTSEAGYGLVGSAVQNGLRLIVVVNGVKTAKERADEAKKLLEWGFRNFEQRNLFAEGPDHRLRQGLWRRQRPRAVGGGRAWCASWCRRAGGEKLIARIVYQGPVPAPVTAGPADRPAQGLARRQAGLADAAQGSRKRRQGQYVAARFRCGD